MPHSIVLSLQPMHIPDGFLSVLVSIAFWIISTVVLVIALRKTRDEVPHGVAVLIRRWLEEGADDYPEDLEPGGTCIHAEIIVERDNHRKIILGSGGEMIRDIRHSAQRELRKLLQRPVRLELHVVVEEAWRDRPDKLDRFLGSEG